MTTRISNNDKIYLLIKCIAFYFLISYCCRFLMFAFEQQVLIPNEIISPSESLNIYMAGLKNKLGPILLLFLVISFQPLLEEVSFRLGLSFKKRDIVISIYTLMFFGLGILNGGILKISLSGFIIYGGIGILLFLLYKKHKLQFLSNIDKKTKDIIIAIYIVSFSFIHIFNFKEFSLILFPWYGIYLFNLLTLSFVITRLRIKNGFLWGYSFHVVNNLLGSTKILASVFFFLN